MFNRELNDLHGLTSRRGIESFRFPQQGDGTEGGYGSGGDAPSQAPPPPAPPSPFDVDIQNLIDLINQNAGQYTDLSKQLQGVAGDVGGVANEFGQIAAGNDPAFQRARDARLALLKANTGAQVNETSDFYGGRGLGGSSADLNTRLRIMQGAGLQEQNISSDLDLQQLNRQFSALQGQQGALQGQAGVLSGSMDPITAMLSLEAIPPALRAQLEAAKNAGKGGDSGGGKSCTIFCLVLTDMLYTWGDLTWEQLISHANGSWMKNDPFIYAGYLRWAIPVKRACQGRPRVYHAVRWFVRTYVLDAIGERPTWQGKVIGWAMRAFSRMLAPAPIPSLEADPW